MFALRGIAVSLSLFLIMYCSLSLAVTVVWAHMRFRIRNARLSRIADWLFALRMLPMVSAAAVTVAFTVPSFLLLEPRSIQEPMGSVPLALGICGVALGICGVANAVAGMLRASRAISLWTRGAEPAAIGIQLPALRIARTVPAMTAVGILRPRILISRAAEFVLTGGEMRTALNHELAHVRRYDNLKKLLLRFVAFPGTQGLEAAWREATEMAADDAAVSNAGEALDLAAALIKLSKLGPLEAPVDLTAGIVAGPGLLVNARIERLICWNDAPRELARTSSRIWALSTALAATAGVAITYSYLLAGVHEVTEWLVR